ncbi:MAG: hypothetical protein IJD21_02275 [Oscillospiraceae bacterium]|nr:hypothetical protein [Oscillospiraceae bacterium]
MELKLTKKQFRRLLDMAYIGNWVLNSARGQDRFVDYDLVQNLLFTRAEEEGMDSLAIRYGSVCLPSPAYVSGGIHEAIADYEDAIFFRILAEELARRDMNDVPIDESNMEELNRRMDAYMDEFEAHGTDHVMVETDESGGN